MKLVKPYNKKYKYTAIYDNGKKVNFGDSSYRDFTLIKNKDEALKARTSYRARHAKDHIYDPYKAGCLSYWILWGDSQSVSKNLSNFKKKFKIK